MYNVPHLPDEFLLHLVIALFGCFVYACVAQREDMERREQHGQADSNRAGRTARADPKGTGEHMLENASVAWEGSGWVSTSPKER